nr:MAG TPA: hypothetical protein [Caudoviricetes sp.]
MLIRPIKLDEIRPMRVLSVSYVHNRPHTYYYTLLRI